jgi:hypothetical protein
LGGQRAGEVAAPLMIEFAERLGIDLYEGDQLGLRVLSDFAGRLFAAGYHFGATETAAQLIEQLPPHTKPIIDFVSPVPEPRGRLGELD